MANPKPPPATKSRRIYDFIEVHPGLTGAQLQSACGIRNAYTFLDPMRRSGYIRKKDSGRHAKWYVSDRGMPKGMWALALLRACRKRGLLRGTGPTKFCQDPDDGFWYVSEYDPAAVGGARQTYRAIFCAEPLPDACDLVIRSRKPDTAFPIFIEPEITNALGPDGPRTWPLSIEGAAQIALVYLAGTSTIDLELPSKRVLESVDPLTRLHRLAIGQGRDVYLKLETDGDVDLYISEPEGAPDGDAALMYTLRVEPKVAVAAGIARLLELCPGCGVGVDTDRDGDCVYCGRS